MPAARQLVHVLTTELSVGFLTWAFVVHRRFGLLNRRRLGQRLASGEPHDVLDIFSARHDGVRGYNEAPPMNFRWNRFSCGVEEKLRILVCYWIDGFERLRPQDVTANVFEARRALLYL